MFDTRDAEGWARHYILTTELTEKLAPPPVPRETRAGFVAERLLAPGRPSMLKPAPRREKTVKGEALREPRFRARLLHAFFHHELQAAELMCWAFLAFPEAPLSFRRGLLGICQDEIRHMNMYRQHIEHLGFAIGDFPIRDWFWKRVPTCPTAISYVALMGMGFEAGNLDLAPSFAQKFRLHGDEEGARVQELIAAEEIPHVQFATHWFKEWVGSCDFETWVGHLPPPLSPAVLRGNPIAEQTRMQAGMPREFVDAIRDYVASPTGRAAATQS